MRIRIRVSVRARAYVRMCVYVRACACIHFACVAVEDAMELSLTRMSAGGCAALRVCVAGLRVAHVPHAA